MTNLISGKEALIALANGEEVECWCENDPSIQKRWTPIKALNEYKLSYFLENKPRFEFRLKPRTITINGIEVPAPFEPEEYEDCYMLTDLYEHGYTKTSWKYLKSVPAWRTKEEIKQVVAALRQVFGGNHDN